MDDAEIKLITSSLDRFQDWNNRIETKLDRNYQEMDKLRSERNNNLIDLSEQIDELEKKVDDMCKVCEHHPQSQSSKITQTRSKGEKITIAVVVGMLGLIGIERIGQLIVWLGEFLKTSAK